ncbi:phage terminase large subunit [Luteitalea sp.]|uniref:phage terminase large subunit n=1 Tax=Luteitalea sp. TaxID=2004800 RepID=UPI0025BD4A92|nr:phage terminase large subunit [Luteitalea sp.]
MLLQAPRLSPLQRVAASIIAQAEPAEGELTSLRPLAQPGPQQEAFASEADIVILGGSAGGGKTWLEIAVPTEHIGNSQFRAVLFRREYSEITMTGGMLEESQVWYPRLGGVLRQSPQIEWRFPSGAKIAFRGLQHEGQLEQKAKGLQATYILLDQLEEFTAKIFWYLLSRNRSAASVPPRVFATINPVPDDDPTGGWVHTLLSWWIDPETGYAIQERSGKVRWFLRLNETLHWGDSREELVERFRGQIPDEDLLPKSITFIRAKLDDNPALLASTPQYRASLLALTLVDRQRLLDGNWKIKPAAGKVFNRAWFEIVDAAPVDARRCRGWDKAGTEGAGDRSAGIRIAKDKRGMYYVEDAVVGQWSSHQRNVVIQQTATGDGQACMIRLEQEPGSGGKESAEISVRELAGYDVKAKPVTGDKLTRAKPFAAQAEAGNVRLVRGDWNEAYLRELHQFEGKDGQVDDQVDASSTAFNALALERSGPAAQAVWVEALL